MVDLNARLPQVRITWVGSLSWGVVLIVFVSMTRVIWNVKSISGSRSDKKAMAHRRLFSISSLGLPSCCSVDLPCCCCCCCLCCCCCFLYWHQNRTSILEWNHPRMEPDFHPRLRTSSSPETFQVFWTRLGLLRHPALVDWAATGLLASPMRDNYYGTTLTLTHLASRIEQLLNSQPLCCETAVVTILM